MKKTKIIYWILNGLFAFTMFGSAIPDLLSVPMAQKGFAEMGMPLHLLPFLGTAKALGVIAILIPGFPRVKEWAYAGLTFDLIGAIWCVAHAPGKTPAEWMPMFVGIALAFGAYTSYHKLRRDRASAKREEVLNLTRRGNAIAFG